jgi:hypothetical protein
MTAETLPLLSERELGGAWEEGTPKEEEEEKQEGGEERGWVVEAGLNMERLPSPPPPKTTITICVGIAARRTRSSSDS